MNGILVKELNVWECDGDILLWYYRELMFQVEQISKSHVMMIKEYEW